jgi:type III secretion protein V
MIKLLLRQNSDFVLALFVVAIAAMLLVPLPTWSLDFLIAINISISVLLLIVGLYMRNALALLAFPALLLLTTLFRLGLNVASTRLILLQGDAGRVIEAFGTLLIRGEIVVGIIIFLIITIVNFIVIARGSSRVSEVAARFALDALPGKQMTIDSDLRSGLVTSEEAQQKRDELRKESQLYGSMDGAMKFVQGDAIAGFFIIVTNIIGGMYMGISSGLSVSDAAQTYTVLTVGDGLVSQIPALLISICAGVIVTRVSSGENSTLGSELGEQLLSGRGALIITGLLLLFIGLLPGLPPLQFMVLGMCFIGGGFYLNKKPKSAVSRELGLIKDSASKFALPLPFLVANEAHPGEKLLLYLDKDVLLKSFKLEIEKHLIWWEEFKLEFYDKTGINMPSLEVLPGSSLGPGEYSLWYAGNLIETSSVMISSLVIETNPDTAPLLGFEVVKETAHPLSGERVFWTSDSPHTRRLSEAFHLKTLNFVQFSAFRAARFFLSHPELVFGLSEVFDLLKSLEKRLPGFLNSSLNTSLITAPRLSEILQELVRQEINIKDFKQIIEMVAAYCSSSRIQEEDYDLQDLVSSIRRGLRRKIVSGLSSHRRTLRVITLNEPLEEMLESLFIEGKDSSLVEPDVYNRIEENLKKLTEPVRKHGLSPLSILCGADVRPLVAQFANNIGLKVSVFTFAELEPEFRLESVGVWSL